MTQSELLNYTSRLLNYVEPYYINGVAKSAFYTEVNTNLTKHSKVFMLNGFNDSEIFISKGKYAKNADGYKVLHVDKCKVVLDIDFNGVTQSYREDEFDKCIKVYHIRSQREFDYINKLFVDSYTGFRVSKFEKGYTNNIIYSDNFFSGTSSGIGINNGLNNVRQFWARVGNDWEDVTATFNYNAFTFSTDYYAAGLTNNGRIYVVGEDITHQDVSGVVVNTYKQRNVYQFTDPSISNSWKIDISHKAPIITKLNFRQGIFRGKHNDGIFGSYLKEENWYGTQSSWTSGFFVNGNWESGIMESKSDNSEASYYASIENGVPIQTTDFSNNKGFGYNYVLDSNVYSGQIQNGNFINCNIGHTNSGLTAIDTYFGVTNSFPLVTIGGLYNYCDIKNTEISNSSTLDSIVDNCYLNETKTLNSQITESYSLGGEFSINGGISVISADMMSYIPNNASGSTSSSIRGVLKLYISDKDYGRLDTFDNFFITKINKDYILSSLDSDQKIVLPYETRYVMDTFWDFKVSNTSQDCFASLKSKFDNITKVEVTYALSNYTNTISTNDNYYASIDIDLGQYLAFYLDTTYVYLNQSIIKKNNVQNLFLKTYISNSDFRNGVINGIKWTSGSNTNYPSNIIKVENGLLKISKVDTDKIEIYLNEPISTINDNQLKVGSYAWIDSVYASASSISISGVYKITNASYSVTPTEATVILSNSSLISPLAFGTTFSVPDSLPTYVSVNKLLIDSSEINNGIFERTLFKNSTFVNDEFNNLDTNLVNANIEKLRLINLLFKDNGNTIKNGLVHKSHILDANWISGISNNSIWKGTTFGNGVFNNGIWESGTFNNGYFQNSRGITLSSVEYSTYQHYKSWLDGTFNNGYFYNSVWLDGTFNNGKLYNSDYYGGIWNNGILGDKNIPTMNTSMGSLINIGIGATQTFWYDGIVENAQVGGDGIVYWYGGKFNNGRFNSNDTTSIKESIWYDGEFNGGDFADLARWKNGTFNKGKFRSYYGWTMSSSTYSSDYSWENGVFNGGQFGVGSYATNSTWYYGEFNGGIFQGRVWNDGVFENGNFNGGSSYSVITDESLFSESFTQSYYGLWRNGWVTNIKHKAVTNQLISTNNMRNTDVPTQKYASLKNMIWVNGSFDHPSGKIENSAWLNGSFKKGNFKDSVFNPYTRRDWFDSSFGTYSTFNTSFDCVWENGVFDNGTFYMSDWKDGQFLNGTMSGGRWVNGVWNYGYAKNIYWTNGTWKNGTWDGSPFNYTNLISNNDMISNKDRDIVLRVSNILRNGKVHLINAFTGSNNAEILLDGDFTDPNQFYGWTYSDTGSLANWIPSINNSGVYLNSGVPTTPSLLGGNIIDDYPSPGLMQRDFVVGSTVVEGDIYSISIQYYYNPNVIRVGIGTVRVTAVSGDTDATIAQKLSDKINDGLTQNVVEYNDGAINYVTWGYFDNSTSYPQSSYSTNTITLITNSIYCSTNGYSTSGSYVGSYDESEILYAFSNGYGYSPSPTTSVFTQSLANYNISLDVSSLNGRTDFIVNIGVDTYHETLNNSSKTLNYNYVAPDNITLPQELGIKRVLYFKPNNSRFFVSGGSVRTVDVSYSTYNNKLYQFATFSAPFTYGITGASVSLPTDLIQYTIANRELVSLKFGNGTFKSGLWESGYWNNGWRSIWNDVDKDFIIFSDVIIGSVLEISPNLWNIKLQAFDGTSGLTVGDRVSVGNIVCIDINENRRLISNYLRIIDLDETTITLEVSLNMKVRRIIKDSENHMIYVSNNVWISGIFYNGYFRGIWNYGLFKGYPYITEMENSHWIDGVFDGGKFASTQSTYLDRGLTVSYNTGLIQNFTFRDNNVSGITNSFLYTSWIDTNYVTYSMTNIFKDTMRYDYDYGVIISDGNLKGFPTYDILSSESIFRNSYNLDYKYYKLGIKYKIYNDFIGNSSYFTYPIKTDGIPGPGEFLLNGWTYSNNSSRYHSNTDPFLLDSNQLVVEYDVSSYTNIGIKAVQTKKIKYYNPYDEPVTPAHTLNAAGSLIRDFSDVGTGHYAFEYTEIGGTTQDYSTKKFSNLSYTSSNWQFYNNQYLSPRIDAYPVTLRDYPSGNISGFNNNDLFGNTWTNVRRAYMMDWFDVNSLDSQYNGYNVSGSTPNSYERFGQTGGFGTFSFYAYRAPNTTTLNINAFVPFYFYGNERYYNSAHRGGWSTFKFVGVVEKCGTSSNPYVESNWTYVASTKLDYYGNSGDSSNGISMDKDKCCIVFDGNLPGGAFIGKLYMNNVSVSVNAGELVRFRLYWIDIRKMFASAGGGVSSVGPGQVQLSIGVESSMNYSENNHGFFEIVDNSTYFNTTTNILDNVYSRSIEKFRYSVIDFDLDTYGGVPYQGPTGSSLHDLPTIYLLNDNPEFTPANFSTIINHATTEGVNKKEYFYNRKALQLFFKSTDTFDAHFGKMSFYETDMIPFFRYTTEANVDNRIKNPYYGVAPFVAVNSSITLDSITQSGG